MSGIEYLLSKGWRCIAKGKGKYCQINYWDHPHHQPNHRGMFTQSAAMEHQKFLDKGNSCQCLNENK